jgi:hypothetical protein
MGGRLRRVSLMTSTGQYGGNHGQPKVFKSLYILALPFSIYTPSLAYLAPDRPHGARSSSYIASQE